MFLTQIPILAKEYWKRKNLNLVTCVWLMQEAEDPILSAILLMGFFGFLFCTSHHQRSACLGGSRFETETCTRSGLNSKEDEVTCDRRNDIQTSVETLQID